MELPRWLDDIPPEELGVLAHGPALVARSRGIGLGVRCVLAHPAGLAIWLALHATGVQAEAAGRRSESHLAASEPVLRVRLDGQDAELVPVDATSGYGEDQYTSELHCRVGPLPADGRLVLTGSWVEAGLAAASVTLSLTGLDEARAGVLRLV